MSKDRLDHVVMSFKFYKQFSDYCKSHPEAEDFVKQVVKSKNFLLAII
jgi:hypothetical protein